MISQKILMDRRFFIAKEEEILSGKVTDIYYVRTYKILEKKEYPMIS